MDENALNEAEARAALHAARGKLLEQAHWPWTRHAACGAIIGGMVAAQAAAPPWSTLIIGVLTASVGVVVASDRARRGTWVSGWREGRTRGVTLLLMAISVAATFVGLWLNVHYGLVWAPVALGAVMAFVGYWLSRVWERVYRRELEEQL